MQNTGNQDCQQKHADNDEGRHHEGNDVFLGWEEIEDRVSRGVGGRLVLQLQAGLHVNHLITYILQCITMYYNGTDNTIKQVKTLQTKFNCSDQIEGLHSNFLLLS